MSIVENSTTKNRKVTRIDGIEFLFVQNKINFILILLLLLLLELLPYKDLGNNDHNNNNKNICCIGLARARRRVNRFEFLTGTCERHASGPLRLVKPLVSCIQLVTENIQWPSRGIRTAHKSAC